MRVCVAKPAYFLKWDFQGREGRGCGRWTWGREVAAVSRRFDVDLKRGGTLPLLKNRHLRLQDAEAGDLRWIREQPERFLSTHLREPRQNWAGKRRGCPSVTWEGRRGVRRRVGHKGYTEGPWQIFSEVGEGDKTRQTQCRTPSGMHGGPQGWGTSKLEKDPPNGNWRSPSARGGASRRGDPDHANFSTLDSVPLALLNLTLSWACPLRKRNPLGPLTLIV